MRKALLGISAFLVIFALASATGFIKVLDHYEEGIAYFETEICFVLTSNQACGPIPRSFGNFLGTAGVNHSRISIHFPDSADREYVEIVPGVRVPKEVSDEYERSAKSEYAQLSKYPATLSRCVSDTLTLYQISSGDDTTSLNTYFTENGYLLGTNGWDGQKSDMSDVEFNSSEYSCTVLKKSK